MKTHINLFDRKNGLFIKLKPGKTGWERFESKTKKEWVKTHQSLTLKEALRFKEDVINNNFLNLFKIITKK